MQVTINIPDSFIEDFLPLEDRDDLGKLEKAFSLFLLHLKGSGNISRMAKAYEYSLQERRQKSRSYTFTEDQIARIKIGLEQSDKREFVPEKEMDAFFLNMRKSFDVAIDAQKNGN